MSSRTEGPVSPPSFTEPVLPIGNPSSNPPSGPSLTNDSSSGSESGTTLHGPYEAQEVKNITRVLFEKRADIQARDKINGHTITINTLPDDVLLEVFDSCRKDLKWTHRIPVWGWPRKSILTLVCQRWRQIILGSPCRLDLQILCRHGTPLRENLDRWPPFPIAIQYIYDSEFTLYDKDNLFAALEHPGRICSVHLRLKSWDSKRVPIVMQVPFPRLTHLALRNESSVFALPGGFLGGSASGLLYMYLEGILYPALPALLSSTSGLVHLELRDIPKDGYISPETIVACLGALPKLEFLCITSQSAVFYPYQILQPPETRTLLLALTSFELQGASEYLEDLISRIDGPRVKQIYVKYLEQPFAFQIINFINRLETSEITPLRHAEVTFSSKSVIFMMYPSHTIRQCANDFIRCQWIGGQVSRMAQVFSQHSSVLSRVVHLELVLLEANKDRRVDEWLPLIRQFSAVRTLRASSEIAGEVALALQDVTGEMVFEVLPVLDFMYLEDQPLSSVEKFLTTRRLSGHPVTIVDTEAEFGDRVKSYARQ